MSDRDRQALAALAAQHRRLATMLAFVADGHRTRRRARAGTVAAMRQALTIALAFAACTGTQSPPSWASATDNPRSLMPREHQVPVGGAQLYVRELGAGEPILVLHGGPDFDHRYLLPDMDRLADSYRLIYYDQRGSGRSAAGVAPEDVTLASEIEDLDRVRRHFGLESVALLGHSFGTVLALEYALRHRDRVSRLILMNPAPASHRDFLLLRAERQRKWPAEMQQRQAVAATAGYRAGDPDAVAAYYRIHFRPACYRPQDLERLMQTMRARFTSEGVLKARQVEERLLAATWLVEQYDLLPELRRLDVPTLVLYGEHDFIPEACARHVAEAIPGARYVALSQCGHFAYLESPAQVRRSIDDFFGR